jgi:hypothetical protein
MSSPAISRAGASVTLGHLAATPLEVLGHDQLTREDAGHALGHLATLLQRRAGALDDFAQVAVRPLVETKMPIS